MCARFRHTGGVEKFTIRRECSLKMTVKEAVQEFLREAIQPLKRQQDYFATLSRFETQ